MNTKSPRLSSLLTFVFGFLFLISYAKAQESPFGFSNSPEPYNPPQETHQPTPQTAGAQVYIDLDRYYYEIEQDEVERKMQVDEQVWEDAMESAYLRIIEGEYPEAEALYKSAVKRAELFGKKDRRYIESAWDLAICYMFQAKYDEAEIQYKELIKLLEKSRKRGLTELAEAVASLGQVYYSSRKYLLALPLYERAQRLLETLYPANDPRVVLAINNLAMLHQAMKHFDEADAYFNSALRITHAFQKVSPVIEATVLENYANFLREIGREKEASALMIQASNTRRLIFAKRIASEAHALIHSDVHALLASAESGDVKAVKRLIKLGVEVNARDDQGLTALMASAESGEKDVLKVLLKAGADVSATDVDGRSALSRARENEHKDVMKVLTKAGAKE